MKTLLVLLFTFFVSTVLLSGCHRWHYDGHHGHHGGHHGHHDRGHHGGHRRH